MEEDVVAPEEHWQVVTASEVDDFDGLEEIQVFTNTPEVNLVILDDMEWNDDDVAITIKYSSQDEEVDLPHDARHMFKMWDRISSILEKWGRREYPEVEPFAYEKDVTVIYKSMFPLTDRGKWFIDWVAEELDAFDTRLMFELDDSELAQEMRQELEVRLTEWRAEQGRS
jgi:hypothetical protein